MFAGYTVASKTKYTFNDTVSVVKTLTTDSDDFCGEKVLQFKLNNTETSYFNGSNADFFYFSPSADTTGFGTSIATV